MDIGETLTVNEAVAESPAGLPDTVIEYEPAEEVATTNEAETAPFMTEHVSEATAPPPDKEQEESIGAKPEPETCTVAPTPAVEGLTVMTGVAAPTWKFAEAESPPGLAVPMIE